MFFNPVALLFLVIFFLLIIFLFVIVQINIIAIAFSEIGIPAHYIFTALFATLVGSFINIPVKKMPQEAMVDERMVYFFGSRHTVPTWGKKETIVAINVGGAVIPVLISIYLLFKTGLWVKAGLVTAFMTFITFRMAHPLRGVGIALPAFIPPIVAAVASVLIAPSTYAPIISYISGSVGTLIGADILNLNKIGALGAPVASIGGAGTFDGIFLNGILAVLLSAII